MSSGAEQWLVALLHSCHERYPTSGVQPAPPSPPPSLGGWLRAERLGQGIGLREMARRLGISASALSQIETGKAQPSVSKLFDIVNLLNVSVDGLLTGDGDGRPGRPGVRLPAAGRSSTRPSSWSRGCAGAGSRPGRTPGSSSSTSSTSRAAAPRATAPPCATPARSSATCCRAGSHPSRLRHLRAGPGRLDQLPGDHPAPAGNDGPEPAQAVWCILGRHARCSVALDAVRRWRTSEVHRTRRGHGHPNVRAERGRLGGAGRLRPAPDRAAGAAEGVAGPLGAGGPAQLRLPQHPLHDLDPHRHLGDGQADPLRPAAPGRRAGHLGLRLGRPPPPALQPLAGRPARPTPSRAGPGPGSPPCGAPSTRPPASPTGVAAKIRRELEAHGLAGEPVGVDVAELPVLAAMEAAGLEVVDGQQVFLDARRIKTPDEITLLTTAATMVDAAYDELYRFLRPGVRENECVGLVAKVLYDLGSEHVEGVNAISGERCSPHPHVYSDRILRPGDPAFFDILHSYNGYRTCYYRCFAVGSASAAMRDAYVRCRDYMDEAIALVKPGATTADIVSVWPAADRVRLPRRGGRLRPPVRARGRAVHLGEADLQPAGLPRPPRGAGGGHAVRPRDLLAGLRRLVGGPDRGGGGGHRRRLRGHHQVPGRGAAGRRPALLGRRTAPCPPPARPSPTATGRCAHDRRVRGAPGRGAAGAVPADGRDPGHREGRLRPVHGRPGEGDHPPGLGPGGGGRRGQRRPGAGRLRVRHLPRPPPRHRPRGQPRGLPGRADEPGHRAVRGQGRLHAPDRGRPQHARVLRDRRRPPADRLRGRLVGQAARHQPGRGGLLRRRGDQHRRLPRGPQPGRRVAAAGAVRLREQPLHGVHLDQDRDRGRPAGRRAGPRLPAPGRGDRRQRRRRGAARRRRPPPPGPGPGTARR